LASLSAAPSRRRSRRCGRPLVRRTTCRAPLLFFRSTPPPPPPLPQVFFSPCPLFLGSPAPNYCVSPFAAPWAATKPWSRLARFFFFLVFFRTGMGFFSLPLPDHCSPGAWVKCGGSLVSNSVTFASYFSPTGKAAKVVSISYRRSFFFVSFCADDLPLLRRDGSDVSFPLFFLTFPFSFHGVGAKWDPFLPRRERSRGFFSDPFFPLFFICSVHRRDPYLLGSKCVGPSFSLVLSSPLILPRKIRRVFRFFYLRAWRWCRTFSLLPSFLAPRRGDEGASFSRDDHHPPPFFLTR